jgi:Ser/Thr protein kinase RdoA (MazF antagonist)
MQEEFKKDIGDLFKLSVTKASVFRDGSDNVVWNLETDSGKKYIARVSKRDMGDEISFEAEWLRYLKSKGLPVVPIVESKSGKGYGVLGDRRSVTVFEFIVGKHLPFDKNTKPNIKAVVSAAKTLALLHNASRGQTTPSSRRRTIYTELERALKNEGEIIEKITDGKEFVSASRRYLALRDSSEPVLVHNDYRVGNIMFNNNLDVLAILDFDWSCIGPAIKDVAHALAEWSFADGASAHWRDIYDIFLESYNEASGVKIYDDGRLREWVVFSCLSDTCTYIIDCLERGEIKSVNGSYMYKKFLYFQNHLE